MVGIPAATPTGLTGQELGAAQEVLAAQCDAMLLEVVSADIQWLSRQCMSWPSRAGVRSSTGGPHGSV